MNKAQPAAKPVFLLLLSLLSFACFSQVTQQWAATYNDPQGIFDRASSAAADQQGNVYVAGVSVHADGIAYITLVKYDPSGQERWVRRHPGTISSVAEKISLVLDAVGNICLAGLSYDEETQFDFLTIKYAADGRELWARKYNGPATFYDNPMAIAADLQGNIYVTGSSAGGKSNNDYATIKYDAAGNERWVKRYNGSDGDDAAAAIAVDGWGNIYVTGNADFGAASADYTTIKYDTDGNELWVRRYDEGVDAANSLAVDAAGNAYVTGQSYGRNKTYDYATVKYSPNGKEQWVQRYNGPSAFFHDFARAVAVDAAGNAYVTGQSYDYETGSARLDIATIKYSTDGKEVWIKRYGLKDGQEEAADLAVDAGGNVYVTGPSALAGLPDDYATIKYDTDGNEVWVQGYNSPESGTDRPADLALDAGGNVYVTGYSSGTDEQQSVFATVKYSQATALLVASFTLVDADKNRDIRELRNGEVIDLATLPTRNLTIRANTFPATVGSVVFQLTGPLNYTHTEQVAPYALIGNDGGDYYGMAPQVGTYTLTATPYKKKYGGGSKGTALTIKATLVDNSSMLTHVGAGRLQGMDHAAKTSLRAAPNPFLGQSTISFSVAQPGYATVELFDAKGAVVQRLYSAVAQAGQEYRLRVDGGHLPAGVYVVRLAWAGKVLSYKLLLLQ